MTGISNPNLIRKAIIEVRSRLIDSNRWEKYISRKDDIIIATYAKSGTTWMQQIIGMLIFQSDQLRPIWEISPWPDVRLWETAEEVFSNADLLTHRRFFKTHLPYEALPIYKGVKFIFIARDGRDVAMSLHHHLRNLTSDVLERLHEIGLSDPKIQSRFPEVEQDVAEFFHNWLHFDDRLGDIKSNYWSVQRSFWKERKNPNILLLHYNDLKRDVVSEMKRIAKFLDLDIPSHLWSKFRRATDFNFLKKNSEIILPEALEIWKGGSKQFFNKGINDRWKGIFHEDDLVLYDQLLSQEFEDNLITWIKNGTYFTGEPKEL